MSTSTRGDEAVAVSVPPRPVRWPRPWWARVSLSPNTHRSFGHLHPRWRGRSHAVAALVWPVVVARIWVGAAPGVPRAAVLAFGAAMWVMLATSAVVHLRRWGVWTTELLFRADHTAIFVAVAGTATPIGLLALEGRARVLMLVLVWGLAVLGWVVVWHPAPTPAGFANSSFIGLGAVVGAFAPAAARGAGDGFLALLALGAAVYVAGAVMVALRVPNLSPRVFGYHEVWHLLVLVGLGVHTLMLVRTLL